MGIDKLDIEILETSPVNLSKLRNVAKNEVSKKTVYDYLVKKVEAIQTIDSSDLLKNKVAITQKLTKLEKST